MHNTCPFCNHNITEKSFASSNGNFALYNLSPILEGHSLIIPEKHIKSLFELSEDEIADFFSFARTITSFLCNTYGADAYDWSLQEGEEAGQSVDHLHLHIIPRKPADMAEGEQWFNKLKQPEVQSSNETGRRILSDAEFNEISERLKTLWGIQQESI